MPPLEAPVQATEDEFSQAFTSFSKDEKPPEAEASQAEGGEANGEVVDAGADGAGAAGGAGAGDSTGGDAGSSAADAGSAEASTGTEAGTGEAEGAGAAAPAAAAPEPAASSSVDDVVKRLAEALEQSKAKEEPAPVVADEPAPLYSAEEAEVLTAYEKDWTDVSKAEELKRRQFGADLVQYVFGQIAPELKRINELAESVANKMHFTEIEQRIGPVDDKVASEVDAWVEKQPTYLQAAYKQVLTKGTVEEVTDLFDRYKKETGKTVEVKPATSGGSELSDAAKQAAESLAPVSSRRSGTEQQDDPNDFGAAFAKFSQMKDD
jgi:hypothetical protein